MPYNDAQNDLPNTLKDRKTLKDLFADNYKYDVCIWDQDRLTRDGFQKFIDGVHNKLRDNHDNYDSFIFAFSGHGNELDIYLSDIKPYGRKELYQFFNGLNLPEMRSKPKILIVDACKGSEEAPLLAPGMAKSKSLDYKRVVPILHPDDGIVVFDSNSADYVSYDLPNGGALMQSVDKVLRRNKGRISLGDLERGIQKEIERIRVERRLNQILDCQKMGIGYRLYFWRSNGQPKISNGMLVVSGSIHYQNYFPMPVAICRTL